MKCPIDNEMLVMTQRDGVEIDYCPKCRGVWLDRGELDKIIERSGALSAAPSQAPERREHDRYDDRDRKEQPYRKRKESFLGDIFDF